jgi:hypothetical protein
VPTVMCGVGLPIRRDLIAPRRADQEPRSKIRGDRDDRCRLPCRNESVQFQARQEHPPGAGRTSATISAAHSLPAIRPATPSWAGSDSNQSWSASVGAMVDFAEGFPSLGLVFVGAGCAFEFRAFSFFIVTSGFGWTARSTFVLANAAFTAGSDAAFGLAARVFAGGWDASS